MSRGLTIGQAAAYAGVTVKTVRHYHRLGLLEEPRRDSSGYRRYTSTDLLRLVQVRTLAAAGVALAETSGLLDADPEGFAAGLADVERQLTDRISELVARRDKLARLADGDRALLPERACAVLERLTTLGFRPDFVAAQREGLILARALAPEFLDGFVIQLEHRLDDPEHVALQKRAWDALSWDPDDPRIEEVATALVDNLLSHREEMEAQADFFSSPDAHARYQVINNHGAEEMPTLARLTALVDAKLRAAGITIPNQ